MLRIRSDVSYVASKRDALQAAPPPRQADFYFGEGVDIATHAELLCAEAVAFRARCCASARAGVAPSSAHLALLAPRLALLRFVASAFPGRGKALLASSQVKSLWEALRSDPERHLLLSWLANAGAAQAELSLSAALSAEARQYVFSTLLVADTEPSSLSAAGWTCFRTFFLRINADRGELELERGDDAKAGGGSSALAGSDAAAGSAAAIARGSVRRIENLAGLERLKAIALSAEDSDGTASCLLPLHFK